ncbi:MAG: Uma2 family endonuclease [Methylococcales bacterium]|nr:Uma2 family endonuclease [Methylococcales bacterium]
MNTAKQLNISINEYLQGELVSDIKYEYINGDVFAMAGAKRSHNIISMNLAILLGTHLKDTPCQTYGSDMKVGILTESDDVFYYPDLHVSCEKSDNELYNVEPKLIIEVLSDSTERKDRAEKFRDYRKLNSLEEYVLVAQESLRVEIYRRCDQWELVLLENEAQFCLDSIALSLNTLELYENVFEA